MSFFFFLYFCANMKAKRSNIQLIVGLTLLYLVCSCRPDSKSAALLSQADSLMQTHPDSALALLHTIEHPTRMNSADRAEYALLFTQANHKNYVVQTSDSLIQVAVDYYADGDDKEREAKAYYYLGCVQEEMNDQVAAVEAYLKALEVKPKESGDVELLTMIYERLGSCYKRQGFYDKAMDMFRASYRVNLKHNKKEDIIYSLQGISSVHMYQERWDSAAYYCNRRIEVARMLGDSTWVSIAFNNMAHICVNQKNYEKARLCVLKSIKEGSNGGKVADNYNLLSSILIELGQLDSAKHYLSLGKSDNDDVHTQAISNSLFYQMEKKAGNYKEAIEYNDAFFILFDSIQELERREEVGKLIDNYALEDKKRELAHVHKHTIGLLFGSFIALAVGLLLLYLIVDRHRNNKYIALQRSLMQNRGEMMRIRDLEPLIAETNTPCDALEEAGVLKKQRFALNIQHYQETTYYQKILTLTKKAKIEEKVFTAEEREELRELIFRIFAETMSDLKKQCPGLTPEDQLYCIFYILGYSNPVIFACTGTNGNALKTRKGRLKAKMSEKLYSFVFLERK